MAPPASTAEKPPRPVCSVCLRPQSTCICRWITPIEPLPEVLILQHPLESREAKSSTPLLHLSLVGSRLVIGETFGNEELQRLLHVPFDTGTGAGGPGLQKICPVLLYPYTQELPSKSIPHSSSMPVEPFRLRLVVLDGTWRKTRKLLVLNPMLQALPRMSLQQVQPSRYRIRKAHAPDQLSTLEATCQALMQLEGNDAKYLPLLRAFDGFVDEQFSRVPSKRL